MCPTQSCSKISVKPHLGVLFLKCFALEYFKLTIISLFSFCQLLLNVLKHPFYSNSMYNNSASNYPQCSAFCLGAHTNKMNFFDIGLTFKRNIVHFVLDTHFSSFPWNRSLKAQKSLLVNIQYIYCTRKIKVCKYKN